MDEHPRIIAHIDLDMFYAAIVLRDDPTLRGFPLIIGNPNARETKRGVVLTATYEARKYGVHSGMSMAEALKRCPQAIIRRSDYEKNKEASETIMNYLKSFNLPIRIASIDEAYIDITNRCSDFHEAFVFVKEIQQWIYDKVKLTVSIGVAQTKIIAKIASDFNKPNAVTVVTPTGYEEFFHGLKISIIPGIGKVAFKRFEALGYTTCGQLYQMDRHQLKLAVGSAGDFLYDVFHGNTSSDLSTRGERKSISHETTFHSDAKDIPLYIEKIEYIFSKTYNELIIKQLYCKTVTVKIRFRGFDTITRSKTLPNPTNDREKLYQAMFELYEEHLIDPRGIRLLGVKFSQFAQLSDEIVPLVEFF
ncbi:MAG: DNA polymerase IV [Candidatus Heimdallarchaeota archaeon]|nr:DNA polymerase IV [Candidatus Heimdallarchaeota archaeon]